MWELLWDVLQVQATKHRRVFGSHSELTRLRCRVTSLHRTPVSVCEQLAVPQDVSACIQLLLGCDPVVKVIAELHHLDTSKQIGEDRPDLLLR
ncbi:hypothetical protein D3C87_1239410 [compost metagenome]